MAFENKIIKVKLSYEQHDWYNDIVTRFPEPFEFVGSYVNETLGTTFTDMASSVKCSRSLQASMQGDSYLTISIPSAVGIVNVYNAKQHLYLSVRSYLQLIYRWNTAFWQVRKTNIPYEFEVFFEAPKDECVEILQVMLMDSIID